jgi:hypothetical protein
MARPLAPWTPWGPTTWQTRSGNRYDRGLFTAAVLPSQQNADPEAKPAARCGDETFFGLNSVALDYFDPSLFR